MVYDLGVYDLWKMMRHLRLGRLNVCRNTIQFDSANARTTSSLTLSVAVAVSAIRGTRGNFCLRIPRP